MFPMHIITAWDDYFTVTNPTEYSSQTYTSREILSGTSVYFSNCLFRDITSTSTGGAIYSNSVTYLLVESSSFFSCKTSSGQGGAIYFSNSGGQWVLHKVCGYDCSASQDMFAYTTVNNAISSKNYIKYSSISRCVNEYSGSWYIMRLYSGNCCYPSFNLSNNKCGSRTILCQPFINSNYVTCSFSYSTFADNIITGYTCLCLGNGAKFEIKSCNIIRNTQSSSSEGIIAAWGSSMIKDSCILENKATYIFYQVNSYTITLSNCTVDKTSNYGSLTIQNTVTKSFILALSHMSTRNCHSEYDSAGALTPITPPSPPSLSPSPSSSKKQKLYYSCERMFYHQCQQGNFLSLSSILVFNFIYLHTSGDLLY
jgi:hypothetical protein